MTVRSIGWGSCRLFALLALAASSSGCLLLTDAPGGDDPCVDHDVGESIGDSLVLGNWDEHTSRFDCPGGTQNARDFVIKWTAPSDGEYELSAIGQDGSPMRVGTAPPECGAELDRCSAPDEDGLIYDATEGESIYIVVEARHGHELFGLFIHAFGEPLDSCPYENDGECDEPQGSDLCPSGTDRADCPVELCPFQNDGQCDEPEGTALCDPGTDPLDCG